MFKVYKVDIIVTLCLSINRKQTESLSIVFHTRHNVDKSEHFLYIAMFTVNKMYKVDFVDILLLSIHPIQGNSSQSGQK